MKKLFIKVLIATVLLGLLFYYIQTRTRMIPYGNIVVTVPDNTYSGPGSGAIKVITQNVTGIRDAFRQFFWSAKRVGLCNPNEIENRNKAQRVMMVHYYGDSDSKYYVILKNAQDEWLTEGYGDVEIYDAPRSTTEYSYSPEAIEELKKWYEENVPIENRK